MKKSLLILVALFTMILIPWEVKAADINVLVNTGDYKCETDTNTATKKKITTCKIAVENTTAKEFKGGTLTLTFTPTESSTTWAFKVDGTNAEQDTKATTDSSVTLNVEPVAAKSTVVIGEVTWTADQSLSAADCGGDVTPSFKGSDAGDLDSDDIVESGYAIPYIALAVGAVGVITVLATSKKKTKMYKI